MPSHRFVILVVIALLTVTACSPSRPVSSPAATAAKSGLDLAGMDKSVAPGDDFNAHANGDWLKATEIPPDKPSYGPGNILADETRKRTVALIQESAGAGDKATAEERKIRDFCSSNMGEAGMTSKGATYHMAELEA